MPKLHHIVALEFEIAEISDYTWEICEEEIHGTLDNLFVEHIPKGDFSEGFLELLRNDLNMTQDEFDKITHLVSIS
ncbi:hypothetical protein VspSw1_133 [Vibrio phage VspSw_1]|uniref:Uncharacterized protein n=1 Tax=Vibrio phage VspSw_1 TaxID=2484249 RepID=A0A411BKN6_9CAUD|nr:hypothetical protein HOV08_gp133 [Vibrio phage VspSw_1]QAY02201.1 hypothetical protein VspSw1_133 [Vibrio phage VspSw_1]